MPHTPVAVKSLTRADHVASATQIVQQHQDSGGDCVMLVFRHGVKVHVEESDVSPALLYKIALALTTIADAKLREREVH